MSERDKIIMKFVAAYAEFRQHVHHPVVLWSEHPNIEQGYYLFGITEEQFDSLKEMIGNEHAQ